MFIQKLYHPILVIGITLFLVLWISPSCCATSKAQHHTLDNDHVKTAAHTLELLRECNDDNVCRKDIQSHILQEDIVWLDLEYIFGFETIETLRTLMSNARDEQDFETIENLLPILLHASKEFNKDNIGYQESETQRDRDIITDPEYLQFEIYGVIFNIPRCIVMCIQGQGKDTCPDVLECLTSASTWFGKIAIALLIFVASLKGIQWLRGNSSTKRDNNRQSKKPLDRRVINNNTTTTSATTIQSSRIPYGYNAHYSYSNSQDYSLGDDITYESDMDVKYIKRSKNSNNNNTRYRKKKKKTNRIPIAKHLSKEVSPPQNGILFHVQNTLTTCGSKTMETGKCVLGGSVNAILNMGSVLSGGVKSVWRGGRAGGEKISNFIRRVYHRFKIRKNQQQQQQHLNQLKQTQETKQQQPSKQIDARKTRYTENKQRARKPNQYRNNDLQQGVKSKPFAFDRVCQRANEKLTFSSQSGGDDEEDSSHPIDMVNQYSPIDRDHASFKNSPYRSSAVARQTSDNTKTPPPPPTSSPLYVPSINVIDMRDEVDNEPRVVSKEKNHVRLNNIPDIKHYTGNNIHARFNDRILAQRNRRNKKQSINTADIPRHKTISKWGIGSVARTVKIPNVNDDTIERKTSHNRPRRPIKHRMQSLTHARVDWDDTMEGISFMQENIKSDDNNDRDDNNDDHRSKQTQSKLNSKSDPRESNVEQSEEKTETSMII